jgi:CPA2 family monovalent cation:H+ antiporter-2
MHDIPRLLVDLAIALGTAAITALVSRKLKLPVIFGYLMAGLLVGPNVPIPLAASADNVHIMAELGVILIMFGIGMEFSIKKVIEAGPTAVLMASIQTALVMISGVIVGNLLGWAPMEGIFIGAGMVATSTVVIVKLFEESRPARALKETVFAVTIIHDLYAIILMTVLIALTKVGGKGLDPTEIGWIIVKFVVFVVGVVGIGRHFIPQFLRRVADKEKPENLVIASIGFCFGIAMLAAASGFSLAIGAFAAGMLAAESGREKVIEKLIMPIRDVFTALFFVSVGMMIVPGDVFAYFHVILAFVFVVVVVNALSLTAGGLFAGQSFRTSFQTSIALGQFGEFAFIMMNIGILAGVVRQELFSVTVSVAVITALTSMYLFKGSGRMADAIESRLPEGFRATLGLYQVWLASLRSRRINRGEISTVKKSAIFLLLDCLAIIGLGAGYKYLVKKLSTWLSILEAWSLNLVEWSLALLLSLGIAFIILGLVKQSRVLAIHLAAMAPNPEGEGSGRGGRHVLAGGLRVLIFLLVGLPTLFVLQALVSMGPLFFSSLVAFIIIIAVQAFKVRRLSRDVPIGMEWLLGRLAKPKAELEGDEEMGYKTGAFRIVKLDSNSPNIGRHLSDLGLSEQTGITVITLLRDGQNQVPLHPSPKLQADDRVVLIGSEHSLSDAAAILTGQHK